MRDVGNFVNLLDPGETTAITDLTGQADSHRQTQTNGRKGT